MRWPDGFAIALDVNSAFERNLYLRDCEPDTAHIIRSCAAPSRVLWDIGSNIGLYSLMFSAAGGRAVAFEPHPGTRERLEQNVRINGLAVTVLPWALADETSTGELTTPTTGNHALATLRPIPGSAIPVDLKRADDLDLPPPDLIKIDVEGAEHAVILGAERTIRMHRPTLIVELCRGNSSIAPDVTIRLLNEWGFKAYWPHQGEHVRVNSDLPHERLFGRQYAANYLFVPNDGESLAEASDGLIGLDDFGPRRSGVATLPSELPPAVRAKDYPRAGFNACGKE